MGQTIRLKELAGKNVINLYDGMRLGILFEPHIAFDPATGHIFQLFLGGRSGFTGTWSEKNSFPIPWNTIEKIGQEVVIVHLEKNPHGRHKRFF